MGLKGFNLRSVDLGHNRRPGLHRKRFHFSAGKDSCGSKFTFTRGSASSGSSGPRGIPPPPPGHEAEAAVPGCARQRSRSSRCAGRQGLPGLVSVGPAPASAAPCRLPEPGAPGSPRRGIPDSSRGAVTSWGHQRPGRRPGATAPHTWFSHSGSGPGKARSRGAGRPA